MYVVPVTDFEFDVQFRSIEFRRSAVEVGLEAVLVEVAVADFMADRLDSASFARLASIPVPAASPMTAADNNATIIERMNTNRVQPQMVPFLDRSPGSDCVAPP